MYATGVPTHAPSVQTTLITSGAGIKLQPASGQTLDVSNARVVNVGAPVTATDAANKSYVDGSYMSAISGPQGYLTQYAAVGIEASSIQVDAGGNATGIASITPPGSLLTLKSNTVIDGNLTVNGSTTTTSYFNISTASSSIVLNNGNTALTPIQGSVVNVTSIGMGANENPQVTNVVVTALTAAVSGNPPRITCAYTASWTPTAGDVVQITGANDPNNNGLYEVASSTNNGTSWFISIKGVNSVTPAYNLFGTNLVTSVSEPACVINVMKLSVLLFNDTSPMWVYGSNTSQFVSTGLTVNIGSTVGNIPVSTGSSTFTTNPTTSANIATNALTVSGSPSALVTSVHNTNASSAASILRLGKNMAASSITWDIGTDYTSSNLDTLSIYHNRNSTIPLSIDTNDTVSMLKVSSPQYAVVPTGVNPGAGILWSDGGALMYGSSSVASASGTANSLATFASTSNLASASTTTPATLDRPLAVTSSVNDVFTVSSSSTNPTLTLTTTSATNKSTISLGKTAWKIGTDTAGTNGDDFYISRSGTNALSVTGATQILNAGYGVSSPQYGFTTIGSSPGSSLLWYDGTRPRFGTNTVAYVADIPSNVIYAISPVTNAITVFADTNGNVRSPNAPMTSTQPLYITTGSVNNAMISLTRAATNTTGFALQTQTVNDVNALYFNGYQDTASGLVAYKSTKTRWGIINNADGVNDRLTIETATTSATTTAVSIQATGMVTFPVGTYTASQSFVPVSSNPEIASTLWFNSTDSRLYVGSNMIALSSDVPSVTDTNPIANNITVYKDNLGNRQTATTTAVLGQAISITGAVATNSVSTPVIAGTLPAVTSNPAYLLSLSSSANTRVVAGIYNTSTGSSSVHLQLGQPSPTGKQWSIVTDPMANGTDSFAIRCGSNSTNPLYIANNNSVLLSGTAVATAYTSLQVNSNTSNRNYVKIFNAGNSSSSIANAVQFGSAASFWELGNDATNNGGVNFYLNNGASTVQSWTAGGTAVTGTITASSVVTSNGLTLTASALNPGSSMTLWYNSALNGLYFGSNKVITSADMPTDTSPVANNLVVYADAAGNKKTATTDTTIGQTLIANQTADATGWLRVRPNSDTAGNIVLQSLTGANLGYSAINFNGYYNAGDVRYNTSKNRWRVGVDQRSTSDKFAIEATAGSTITPFVLDSATSDAQFTWPLTVTKAATSNVNSIVSTFTSSVTVNGRVNMRLINSATNNSSASILIGKPFVSGASLTWEMGCDTSMNNTDNFYIRHNNTSTNSLVIGANDLVTATVGYVAPRYDVSSTTVSPSATSIWYNAADDALRPRFGANKLALLSDVTTTPQPYITFTASSTNPVPSPNDARTLWASSVDTTHVYYGANKLLIASDLTTDTNPIANSLVVYTDVNGNRGTPTTTVTCAQPLSVAGALSASSASITGSIGAASAVLSGLLTANSASITTSLSAASATVSGALSAGASTLGPVTIDGGTASGVVSCIQASGSSSANNVQIVLRNTAVGQSGTSIVMGQPDTSGSRTWALRTGSSTNDFSLWTRSGAGSLANTNVLYVDAATTNVAGVVQCQYGVLTQRLDITSASSNPGGANTLWYNAADDALRPRFGANKLALLSDVSGTSQPYVTFITSSSNPVASPNNVRTLWASSVDTTHVYYGANKLLIASDVTTDTNPIANSLIVYTDVSGNKSTPTTTVTCAQPLTVTGAITTTSGSATANYTTMSLTCSNTTRNYLRLINSNASGSNSNVISFGGASANWELGNDSGQNGGNNFYIRSNTLNNQVQTWTSTDTTTSVLLRANKGLNLPAANTTDYFSVGPNDSTIGTVTIQSLAGSNQGITLIWFNGYYDGSDKRFNSSKSSWNTGVNQSGASDYYFLDLHNPGTVPVMRINASDKVINASEGVRSKRHDLASVGSNPGSTDTMWYNSGLDSLRPLFGANRLGLFVDTPRGNRQVFTSAGSGSITTPSANYTLMHVWMIGGGGGGGAGHFQTSGDVRRGGGGGSGGSIYQFTIPFVSDTQFSYVIGTGGAGGTTATGIGGTGGETWLGFYGYPCWRVTGGGGGRGGGFVGAPGVGGDGHLPGGGGGGTTGIVAGGSMTATLVNGVSVATDGPTRSSGTMGGNGWLNPATNTSGWNSGSGGQGGGPRGGAGGGYNPLQVDGTPGTYGCGGGGGRGGALAGVGYAGGAGVICIWYT